MRASRAATTVSSAGPRGRRARAILPVHAGVLAMVLAGWLMAGPAHANDRHDHGAAAAGDAAAAPELAQGPAELDALLSAQLEVLARTEAILAEKLAAQGAQLEQRARAAYKLLRASRAPVWSAGHEVLSLAQRCVAARHVLAQDSVELAALDEELRRVIEARERVERERQAARRLTLPAPGSLRLPVARSRVVDAFGVYRHSGSRAKLTRRGIELSTRPGRNVRAPADGQVRHVGPARGLDTVVIVDHGDFLSIFGRLTATPVTPGTAVAVGDILGEAAGNRVYMEIRVDLDSIGYPVDPKPLIAWP